jgi:hypothetical protein
VKRARSQVRLVGLIGDQIPRWASCLLRRVVGVRNGRGEWYGIHTGLLEWAGLIGILCVTTSRAGQTTRGRAIATSKPVQTQAKPPQSPFSIALDVTVSDDESETRVLITTTQNDAQLGYHFEAPLYPDGRSPPRRWHRRYLADRWCGARVLLALSTRAQNSKRRATASASDPEEESSW